MRKRLEQDGLLELPKTEMQSWTTKVYIHKNKQVQKYKVKNGDIHYFVSHGYQVFLIIPKDIARFLQLKHKDKVLVAIRKIMSNGETKT